MVTVPDDSFHFDEVNYANKFVFRANRQLNRAGVTAQFFFNGVGRADKVRTDAVHFVNVSNTRNVVFIRLTPYGFRLGFYTLHAVKTAHGTVQHTQRTFHFGRKVHVAGSVNNVELAIFPYAVDGRGGNRDTSFAFLFHPVGYGRTIVRFTDFVHFSGVIQNTFGSGGLTRINVRDNTDISDFL